MKFIILTTLLFAFKALAEEEIVCQSGCPTNLQNPICLQVQDKAGKIIKKVDVDSQCQLDKYKCDNKILRELINKLVDISCSGNYLHNEFNLKIKITIFYRFIYKRRAMQQKSSNW